MKKCIYILFFLSIISANAQTGPGGVGATDGASILRFWYDANNESFSDGASVNSVSDKSGYANTLTASGTEQPTFTLSTASANSMSSFSFDGGDELETTYNGNSNENMSFFMVLNYTSAAELDVALQHGGRNTIGFSATDFYTDFVGGSNHTSTSTATGNWEIHSKTFANSGTNRLNFYVDNSNTDNFTHTIENRTSNTWIGGNGTGGGTKFNGNIAEVIKYTSTINTAQRIIIDNYLAAKYNISLASNDFYNEDNAGNGNFDFNVAGIGQASDGTNHTDSQGTGIIRISNPAGLGNDEFLFWGEEVEDADYDFSSSSATNYIERIDTKWRVSRRNNPGRVTVRVNASDLTFNSADGCNQLQLVVDNNSDFSSPENTYTFTLSGGVYTATSVRLRNNRYFTLQYVDQIVLDGATAYNGSGGSNKPNTSDDCYKLLVKSNTLSLTENGDVREVEVESGAILAVATGNRLQVTNGINNSGEIRLVGTSQLVQTHTGTDLNTGSGNLFVDQTASTSTVYHSGYWTSPVTTNGSTFTIDDVLKDGTNVPTAATSTAGEAANINFISGFDGDATTTPIEISTRWLAKLVDAADWTRLISPTGQSFSPGEGWNMKSVGATFTFKGRPNDGLYTIPISQDNFSLVGNPYPSALDSEAFITENSSEIDGTLYLYDSSSDNTHVRNDYTGTYTTIVSGVTIGGGRYLPIGQAFFVTRSASGSGTITFQNSQRAIIPITDTAGIIAKNDEKEENTVSKFPILRLGFQIEVDNNFIYKRQLAVAFRGKTNRYENGFDAEMFYKKPSDLGLKIEGIDKFCVISSIENFNDDILIPLKLDLDVSRTIKIKIDKLEKFDDVSIILNDKLTDKKYNLSKEDAILNLVQGNYHDRFYISFKYELLNDVNYKFVKLYHNSNSNSIVIRKSNPVDVNKIKIYTLNGKLLFEENNNHNKNRIEFHLKRNFSKGIYIINLETDKGSISQKILL